MRWWLSARLSSLCLPAKARRQGAPSAGAAASVRCAPRASSGAASVLPAGQAVGGTWSRLQVLRWAVRAPGQTHAAEAGLRSHMWTANHNEDREIRAPNLLIWNQTRCRCAISPMRTLEPLLYQARKAAALSAGAPARPGITQPATALEPIIYFWGRRHSIHLATRATALFCVVSLRVVLERKSQRGKCQARLRGRPSPQQPKLTRRRPEPRRPGEAADAELLSHASTPHSARRAARQRKQQRGGARVAATQTRSQHWTWGQGVPRRVPQRAGSRGANAVGRRRVCFQGRRAPAACSLLQITRVLRKTWKTGS